MKINEINTLNINDVVFKLSDRSVTVKSNNKTNAVINDIQKVNSLSPNKKFDIHMKHKGLNKYLDALYVSHDEFLYYFCDKKHYDVAKKLYDNGYEQEWNSIIIKTNDLTEAGVTILYINAC